MGILFTKNLDSKGLLKYYQFGERGAFLQFLPWFCAQCVALTAAVLLQIKVTKSRNNKRITSESSATPYSYCL